MSHIPADRTVELLDLSVGGLLARAADQHGDSVALVGDLEFGARREWTYGELLRDATELAQSLVARFEPGEHVAIWMPNCPEWVLLEFACGLAGLVIVTVNPAFRRQEAAYVLGQSQAVGVFYASTYRDNPIGEHLAELRPELPRLREFVALAEFDGFRRTRATSPLPAVDPDSPAQIQYTSGTTGFPKGALLRHRAIVNNALLMGRRLEMGPSDVSLNFMPMFHTGGCVCGTLIPVVFGARHVILTGFDPTTVLAVVESERVTELGCVTTMFTMMLEDPSFAERDLSSLRAGWTGGATVPAELVRRVESSFGLRLSVVFGQTESGPTITQTRLDDDPVDKAETVGMALAQTEVKIIDTETGEVVPVGESGELCTRGYLTMAGYFDLPEPTAQALDADGWLHTGDVCTMDDRGYFTVSGRIKEMIIRGGENIYPREIEAVLIMHPDVLDAAVLGVPDPVFGEQPAAVLRVAPGVEPDPEELRQFVRQRLAPHKVPRQWHFVDHFPLSPSGKVKKYLLRDELLARPASEPTPVQPVSASNDRTSNKS